MRFMKYAAMLSVSAFVLSVGAFAKTTKDAGSFDLTQKARIGSTELPPGHYKAEWNGNSGNTQISILRDHQTVATVEGRVKVLPQASPYDAVTLRTSADHTKSVEEIDFNNRKDALVIPHRAG